MRYIPSEEERLQAALVAARGPQPYFQISADGQSITCLTCHMTSHHPQDVQHRYCGKCNTFHPTLPAGQAV
jgi:hypothetical protein